MIEVLVDQDKVQEQVPIEIGLDALSVGSMIILPKTVQIYQIQKKEQSEQKQHMLNLEEDKTTLKVLAMDTYKYSN